MQTTPRIKVTGFIDVAELDPEDVDLGHETGLSPAGYERLTSGATSASMEDVEFTLEQPEGMD